MKALLKPLMGNPMLQVKVFCEEAESETGHSRSFVAAALPAMWRRYTALPPHARHFYEVCDTL